MPIIHWCTYRAFVYVWMMLKSCRQYYSKSEGVCVINNVYQRNPQIELRFMLSVLIALHQGAVMHALHM